MPDGLVEYDIRASLDKLKDDLKESEKEAHKGGLKLDTVAKGTAKAVGISFAAVGTAAAGIGGAAISISNDFNKAMNGMQASTGASAAQMDEFRKTAKDIYADNFGESFEDIAKSMSSIKQVTGLTGDELKKTTENAFKIRDAFELDVNESINAAQGMMENFGISADEAYTLIAQGAQNGANKSGDMLDIMNEYSVQFAKAGLSAEDMTNILIKGAKDGAWQIDKVGDAVKEFSIRAVDGSKTTAQGFAAIGLNADEMSVKMSKGGADAKEAFNKTVQALVNMKDPLAQQQAGVALFGTQFEDLGIKGFKALADIDGEADSTADTLSKINGIKYNDLGSMFEGLKRSLELLLLPLGDMLIPTLTKLIQEILPVIEEMLPPLLDGISAFMPPILQLISELLPTFIELFTQLSPIFTSLMESLPILTGALSQLLPPILQLASELLPVFVQLFSSLAPIFADLMEAVLPVLTDALKQLLPPIMQIISELLPPLIELFKELAPVILDIATALIPPLVEIIKALLPPIMELIDALLPPLIDLFHTISPLVESLTPIIKFLAGVISDSLKNAIEFLMPVIENLMDWLKGLITFITGVFSGDWEKAWTGIKDMVKAVFNAIPAVLESVINSVIEGINKLIHGINKISSKVHIDAIPDIDEVSLPRFHAGGIVDFNGKFEAPALLKDGEMVLTSQQQKELFNIANGMYMPSDISGGNNSFNVDEVKEAVFQGMLSANQINKKATPPINLKATIEADKRTLGSVVLEYVDGEQVKGRR